MKLGRLCREPVQTRPPPDGKVFERSWRVGSRRSAPRGGTTPSAADRPLPAFVQPPSHDAVDPRSHFGGSDGLEAPKHLDDVHDRLRPDREHSNFPRRWCGGRSGFTAGGEQQ